MGALLPAGVASAQVGDSAFSRDQNVSVRERPRPDFDALGIRAGSFLVFPKAQLTYAYEDNIFAQPTNEESDSVGNVLLSVDADSQWSRHALQLHARTNTYRYAEFDNENNTTWALGGDGRIDVIRGAAITGGLMYERLVESRSSPSNVQAAQDPIEYDRVSVDLGGRREINRFRVSGALRYRDYDFDNAVSFLNTPIDLSYRDYNSFEQEARADYAISPALAIYANASHNAWSYDVVQPGGVNRDASGYDLSLGSDFEFSRLVRGQVQAGYLNTQFDDPRIGDVDGLSLKGRVEWFPTPLLTGAVEAERSVIATGVIGAAGALRTTGSAQLDYELLRNLIITGRAVRYKDDYSGIDRTDDIWQATAGATYLISRKVGVNATYTYQDQKSSGLLQGQDFSINRVQVSLVLQY